MGFVIGDVAGVWRIIDYCMTERVAETESRTAVCGYKDAIAWYVAHVYMLRVEDWRIFVNEKGIMNFKKLC